MKLFTLPQRHKEEKIDKKYRNDVDALYRNVLGNEKVLSFLFVVVFLLSIANSYCDSIIIVYLLLASNIIYIAVSFYTDLILKSDAEKERRKTMIADAFQVDITSNKTEIYYNNRSSVKKLGVDSFESTLYIKTNLHSMIRYSGLKILFILIMWLIIFFNIEEGNMFIMLVQGLFSAEVLLNYIKMIYYHIHVSKMIYDDFYKLFVTKNYNETSDLALVIKYVMDYETIKIKSYCHIMLSSSFFEKNKDSLSLK